MMQVTVRFFSYFKDLAGCAELRQELPPGSTVGQLTEQLGMRFPKLGALGKSMLTSVGVEYRDRAHVLHEGDEVSFFPPVQGG